MIYLASPYSHPSAAVRKDRFKDACARVAALVMQGEMVYSPICHWHPVAEMFELPKGFEFWKNLDFAMIERCYSMEVLCIDGWKESIGVQAEIAFAMKLERTIWFSTPEKSGTYQMQRKELERC